MAFSKERKCNMKDRWSWCQHHNRLLGLELVWEPLDNTKVWPWPDSFSCPRTLFWSHVIARPPWKETELKQSQHSQHPRVMGDWQSPPQQTSPLSLVNLAAILLTLNWLTEAQCFICFWKKNLKTRSLRMTVKSHRFVLTLLQIPDKTPEMTQDSFSATLPAKNPCGHCDLCPGLLLGPPVSLCLLGPAGCAQLAPTWILFPPQLHTQPVAEPGMLRVASTLGASM